MGVRMCVFSVKQQGGDSVQEREDCHTRANKWKLWWLRPQETHTHNFKDALPATSQCVCVCVKVNWNIDPHRTCWKQWDENKMEAWE